MFTSESFYKQAMQFWGFNEFPFRPNPDIRFLYISESIKESIRRTIDGIDMMTGFSAVWGDFGTGKTTLMYYIYWRLKVNRDDLQLVLIPNPTLVFRTKTSVYRQLVHELGGTQRRNFENNVNQLTTILAQLRREGKKVVVLIDEVQDMTLEGLKTLRELSNIETSKEKMIHFVLFGSSDILPRLKKMRSLQNRIMSPSLLSNFTSSECTGMIHFRLRQALNPDSKFARGESRIFPEKVCQYIWELTEGHPRDIVRLCHDAMRIALKRKSPEISIDDIDEAWNTLQVAQGEVKHELQRTS